MKLLLYICVASMIFAGSLGAQNETGVLTGRVLDPAGLGVTHARMQLVETANGAVRSALSGDGGFYRFDLLPPGDYSIRVMADGFKTYADDSLHLDVARASSLDVKLTLGAVAEYHFLEALAGPLTGLYAWHTLAKETAAIQAAVLANRQIQDSTPEAPVIMA